ncbi:MAG: cytochrome c4 [Betaproteobacteria bacterium]|nr:MAG: cytochrome c4 [Betaproteobacteria bacterium]
MRTRTAFLAAAALAAAGCSNLERSRETANPAVPAVALAQQVCSNCHGVDGNSVSPNFPNLAAQTEPYLIEQLSAFRKHSRSDPAGFEYMWGLSRHLTDEQIKGLAAYFAGQKVRPLSYASGDPKLIDKGKAIFESGVPQKNIPACTSCHGPAGLGNGQYPRIAYQYADYIVKQLTVFQRTDERPEAAVMKVVAHDLTREDVHAVASYLEALPLAR